MTYSEQLTVISQLILDFDKKTSSEIHEVLEYSSVNRIKIYQKNLFYGVYNNLSSDLTGLTTHLGVENFRFLLKKYLLENRITSANISEFSKEMVKFLDNSYDFHQDPLLVPLAKLDLLYVYRDTDFYSLPIGLFDYWNQLLSSADAVDIDINLNKYEIIEWAEIDGEACLRKRIS